MEWPYSQARHRNIFPTWTGNDIFPEENEPPIRGSLERKRQHLRRAIGVAIAFLCFLMMYTVVSVSIGSLGSDSALDGRLSDADLAELGLKKHPERPKLIKNNPWRGAGNRRRSDLIMSIPGCGGSFRRSISKGDSVELRFAARDKSGDVIDSSRISGLVSVVVGSGQVDHDVEQALVGVCEGEAVRFVGSNRGTYLVYVVRVGQGGVEEAEAEVDRISKALQPMAADRKRNCDTTCSRHGLVCTQDGFKILNNCARLREAFTCVKCEEAAAGSAGPDMPCYVSLSAPRGHARGYCMVNPKAEMATCSASYEHTRRLCPCIKE